MKLQLPKGDIDTHCHLTDLRVYSQVDAWISKQQSQGIGGFILGGVEPEEWDRQRELARRHPSFIFKTFGIHPYFVSRESDAACEVALEKLKNCTSEALALGEMGLDFRTQIVGDRKDSQMRFFKAQLDLATTAQKAIVLHIVRAHKEAQFLLQGYPLIRGMVHSFNSGIENAKKYIAQGLYLSVGGPLHKDNSSLWEAVRWAPLDRLLIESDSPDQPPPELASQLNEPWTIHLVAQRISEIKGLEPTKVREQCRRNLLELFHKELKDESGI